MKRGVFAIILISIATSGFFIWEKSRDESVLKTTSVDEVIASVLDERKKELEQTSEPSDEQKINILLLGLDQRKDWPDPHCDAIHLFTIDLENKNLTITSVPRGTYARIMDTHLPEEAYLSNACGIHGLEYGISEIERVLGVKHDYLITVNFSQALGIFRELKLPTTETLQWLRHRQSYAIGEPQRSHNQAVFMKDLIHSKLGLFANKLTLPLQYLLYTRVDTDMNFPTVRALLTFVLKEGIDQDDTKIRLLMKPNYNTVDYHIDLDAPGASVEPLIERLNGRLNEEDLSHKTLEATQEDLISYLTERLTQEDTVTDMCERQLWLQVEDDKTRNRLEYDFISRCSEELEHDKAVDLLSDYILELETRNDTPTLEQNAKEHLFELL